MQGKRQAFYVSPMAGGTPVSLPIFTSDSLNVYWYALLSSFWTLARGESERTERAPVAGGKGSDLRPGEEKLIFGASWCGSRMKRIWGHKQISQSPCKEKERIT